ncbi:hypothetical protein STSP2_01106 [Anaerohalosphaera lusitana]|uniref:Uncharacterized protein n=1 Tax=Anaerohalosphaera lusitana TaxID=1936003 RepID=A0A1U9NJP1_9BACT|nr:hypothetical protein [Anaerohalosphaera lusitana]AQT67954.1 hypothetical protein STSP2_01106 [Anaerohalosphaera lusitana]
MSITVAEKFDSPQITKGQNPSATCSFIVQGTDDESEALSALLAQTPDVYQDMPRNSHGIDHLAQNLWEGAVHYGSGASDVNSFATSFDTTGGTQHITQSLSTISAYAKSGSTAPLYGGAIGVTKSDVTGVDITVPVFNFSERHFILDANANALTYRNLTGCVNNLPFRGFAVGEVLFLGATGSIGQDGLWEVNFKFAASQNKSNITVGSITGIVKGGWDYMWVRYEDTEDMSAGAIVKRPTAVYVERVYPLADFSLLGIGA